MKRDFLSIKDLTKDEIEFLIKRAIDLKVMTKKGVEYHSLKGKSLGMVFEKPSTRTRISFEVGMYQLGGYAVYLSPHDMQMGRGETIPDTAMVLSRYLDGVMIRTFSHKIVEEFAAHATISVINGLTDLLHPCQILADMMTIVEQKGSMKGVKVAYVGDGNNVVNSWIEAATIMDLELAVACPRGYEPDKTILKEALRRGTNHIVVSRDPFEVVKGADVLYTDVWVSMGQEEREEKEKRIFYNYQVNEKLLDAVGKEVAVMHCLPAHRGEEITNEVFESRHSIVFDQAENRLHSQKALLEFLISGERDAKKRDAKTT